MKKPAAEKKAPAEKKVKAANDGNNLEGNKPSLLSYDEAMKAIDGGHHVKLPEWGGYWTKGRKNFEDPDQIAVVTKDGEVLFTPHHDIYKDRNDWEYTDGKTPATLTRPLFHVADPIHGNEEINLSVGGGSANAPGTVPDIESSKSFDSNLKHIHAGKKMKLESEKGFYFIFEQGRLKKFSEKSGDYVDSAPLYAFQEKGGWSVAGKK